MLSNFCTLNHTPNPADVLQTPWYACLLPSSSSSSSLLSLSAVNVPLVDEGLPLALPQFSILCYLRPVVANIFYLIICPACFGLPLFLLPSGFHFITSDVQLFLTLDAWPVHFHFNVSIICKVSVNLSFVLLQCYLVCSSNLFLASFVPCRVGWT